MCLVAVVWVLIIVVIGFILPTSSVRRAVGGRLRLVALQLHAGGHRRRDLAIVGIWWLVGAQQHVHGPAHTIGVDGARRAATSARLGRLGMSATLEVLEPATEAVLAEIPRAGVEEADAAVARRRRRTRPGARSRPADRAALLHRLADALEERARGAGGRSRRATPASRSATRAARWGWSSRPSATTRARRSGCWATRSRSPAASAMTVPRAARRRRR